MTYNDLSKQKTSDAKPLVTPAPANEPEASAATAAITPVAVVAETADAPVTKA